MLAAVAGALALALVPDAAEGSPRRGLAAGRALNVRRPLGLRVAELGAGPASGMLEQLREALVLEAAARGEVAVLPETTRSSRFALRVAVTRFERERGSFGYRVRCAVSILVEESPGGRVRMVLTGRATSEGEQPRTEARARALDAAAMRAAVRGALRNVTRAALLASR